MAIYRSRQSFVLLFFAFVFSAPLIFSQQLISGTTQLRYSFLASPLVSIPILASGNVVELGPGGTVEALLDFSNVPVSILGTIDFVGQKRSNSDRSMLRPGIEIGAGLRLRIGPRLLVTPFVSGGITVGLLQLANNNFSPGVSPSVSGGLRATFQITPALALSARGSFRYVHNLYTGIEVALGVGYYSSAFFDELEKPQKASIEPLPLLYETNEPRLLFKQIEYNPIFPVFRKYYNDNPIGSAVLTSYSGSAVSSVTAELFIPEYMSVPKQLDLPTTIEGDQQIAVDLYALLGENVLQVTEDTLTAVEISLSFLQDGFARTETFRSELRFLNRNAMTWDDDKKACAFVTSKDPAILSFAKNVNAASASIAPSAVDENLLKAMALYTALTQFGMSYVIDPSSPYISRSENAHQVDFLQFPRQSLQYRSGDCDDLSILFNALLESVGVETAFITIPGHIYMAFATKMSSEDALKQFQRADDFILRDERIWVPVEITELGGNFLRAWQIGAKQWREYSEAGTAAFYPTHEGWRSYEAVGLPSTETFVDAPDDEVIRDALSRQLSALAEREIGSRIQQLRGQIGLRNRDNRLYNSIGVLYARYGLYESARSEFDNALQTDDYAPALINLANMEYLAERYETALDYYLRAEASDPENAHAMLGLARVHYELEDYERSRAAYANLYAKDSALAEKFAYLDLRGNEKARATDRAGLKGAVEWLQESTQD